MHYSCAAFAKGKEMIQDFNLEGIILLEGEQMDFRELLTKFRLFLELCSKDWLKDV
jgi:hypothetical protein